MDKKNANTEISKITQKITQVQDEMNKYATEYSSKVGDFIVENERCLRSNKKQKERKKWLYLILFALSVFLIGIIMKNMLIAYLVPILFFCAGCMVNVLRKDNKYALGYQIRQSLYIKNRDVTDKDAKKRLRWDNKTMLTGKWVCDKCGQINSNNNDGSASSTCIACKTKRF